MLIIISWTLSNKLESLKVKFQSKYEDFHSRTRNWKCCTQNVGHFVQVYYCQERKKKTLPRDHSLEFHQTQVSRAGTSNYFPQYLWDVITCLCLWYPQKQVSGAGTSNYIPQYLWDVISCPCPWCCFCTHVPNISETKLQGPATVVATGFQFVPLKKHQSYERFIEESGGFSHWNISKAFFF